MWLAERGAQGTGKAKKPHVIKGDGTLDEFIKKHLSKARRTLVCVVAVFCADMCLCVRS